MFAHPSIAHAFAAQARATPEATALFTSTVRLSYAELESRVSAVASELALRGVGPAGRVGVAFPRSIDAVVAMLAVWWRGATVVPIDPEWPAARRAFVERDAGLACILGPDAHAEGAALRASSHTDPVGPAGAPSHVFYTSGSTGTPKGVVLSHRSTLHRVAALAALFPFRPNDVACARTPPIFVDASAEILGPLLHGASLYVPPHPLAVADLVRAVADHGVTRLVIVPSLLALLLDASPDLGERAPSLSLVVSSGEALTSQVARRFFEAAPKVRLVNVYGSTEVGGDATFAEVTREMTNAAREVPIGRPLPGARVELRDATGEIVSGEGEGEIVVGGPMLADGYANRPELTRERFVQNARNETVFRTGDIGRRDRNGVLFYLGRRDDQIKVGGVRIELGEIDARLGEAPWVRAAASAKDERGRIVAAVVAPWPIDLAAVRAAVERALPRACVPSLLVQLDDLPRKESGKIDRAALAHAVVAAHAAVSDDRAAAPTEARSADLEARVTAWMREACGASASRGDDTFEALGGDSLARLRLLVRLEREGWSLAHADLPSPLTGATLTATLAERNAPSPPPPFVLAASEARVLRRRGFATQGAFPLTDFQRCMLADSVTNRGTSVWSDQATYRVDGPLDPDRLEAAWRDEIASEPSLRTVILWRDLREPLQVPLTAVPFELARIDARDLSPAAFFRRVLAEEWRAMSTVFPIDVAPLFRVALVRGPAQQNALIFTYHHALLDGESARIVLRRVFARIAGVPLHEPNTSSFREHVERARSDEGARAARAVSRELEGFRAHEERDDRASAAGGDLTWNAFFGLVRARKRVARARVARHRAWNRDVARVAEGSAVPPSPYAGGDMGATPLPVAFTRALRAWAHDAGVTTSAVWAALYAIFLVRDSGAPDVVYGVMLSGRDGKNADAVGMFANCLPLRLRVAPEETLGEVVQRASRALRLLESSSLAPLGAVTPADARVAAMTRWLVSWGFHEEGTLASSGLRVHDGRGVTIASTHLALLLSQRGEAMELGVGSHEYLQVDRVRRELIALADALLDVPRETKVQALLDLRAPGGGMWVALPDL